MRLIRRQAMQSVEQLAASVSSWLAGDSMESKTLSNLEAGRGRVGCSWERAYALAWALGLGGDPRPILVKDEDKKECMPKPPAAPRRQGRPATPRRPEPTGPGREDSAGAA